MKYNCTRIAPASASVSRILSASCWGLVCLEVFGLLSESSPNSVSWFPRWVGARADMCLRARTRAVREQGYGAELPGQRYSQLGLETRASHWQGPV